MRNRLSPSQGGLLAAFVWWSFAAMLVAAGYGDGASRFSGFAESLLHFLPYYWLWAALSLPLQAANRSLRFGSRPAAIIVLAHVVLACAASIAQIVAYIPLETAFHGEWGLTPLGPAIREGIQRHLAGNLLTYFAATAVFYADDYRVRTQSKLAQAKLEMLRLQLQPHFLFNTLQVAASLTHSNPDAAEEMLEQLGDFLRILLKRDDRPLTTVRDELDLLSRYTTIMKYRFGSRLVFTSEHDPSLSSALVPALLLQPLVENAITHGIGDRAQGGEVRVRIARDGSRIAITVDDDGSGTGSSIGEGIGLQNTRERLAALYGRGFDLALTPNERGGTRVAISIPLAVSVDQQRQVSPASVREPGLNTIGSS